MNKRRKQLLADLKKICAHFKLNFSNTEVVRKAAFAVDTAKKKLLLIHESDHPYFKTIDLKNVDACTVKVDYKSISAGDLDEKSMNNFVDRIELRLSHIDPSRSVNIGFYDTKEDNVSELQQLIDKATGWRDKITSMLPGKVKLRA
jgi:hypothetical protein